MPFKLEVQTLRACGRGGDDGRNEARVNGPKVQSPNAASTADPPARNVLAAASLAIKLAIVAIRLFARSLSSLLSGQRSEDKERAPVDAAT